MTEKRFNLVDVVDIIIPLCLIGFFLFANIVFIGALLGAFGVI